MLVCIVFIVNSACTHLKTISSLQGLAVFPAAHYLIISKDVLLKVQCVSSNKVINYIKIIIVYLKMTEDTEWIDRSKR